jgi:hypothetical protein
MDQSAAYRDDESANQPKDEQNEGKSVKHQCSPSYRRYALNATLVALFRHDRRLWF